MVSENTLKPIRLYCEYSSAPGLSWNSEVRFLPAGASYEIWNRSEDNLFDSEGEQLVGTISDVSWRGIATWLRSFDDGLAGAELFNEIDVQGLESFAADIVAMCWISMENEYSDVLDFLLSRSDTDLAFLHRLGGDHHTADWFYEVGQFQEFVEELDLSHLEICDILRTYGLQDRPASENLLDDLRDEVNKAQERESRSETIQNAVQTFKKYEVETNRAADIETRCAQLQDYLSKWIDDLELYPFPPEGFAEIAPYVRVDLDLLFHRVEGHLRRVKDRLLDKTTMEYCTQYSSPRPGPEFLRLLESWIGAEIKPQAAGDATSLPIDEASEAEFLIWLFAHPRGDVAQYAAKNAPDAYRSILNWVVARQVRPFTFRSTYAGGYGAHTRRKPWNKWETFVKKLKTALDEILP